VDGVEEAGELGAVDCFRECSGGRCS
jgi:hypothetical protein